MSPSEQKLVLESFLMYHGIEMLPTARLSHYGRRFRAYFPQIANSVHPEGAWTKAAVASLADYVSGLDPADFDKCSDYEPPKPTKYKKLNRIKAFFYSWEWKNLRYKVLRDRGRKCEVCGAIPGDLVNGLPVRIEVDHIKPISKYWHLRLDRNNLQCACSACNRGKGAWDQTDWRSAASAA